MQAGHCVRALRQNVALQFDVAGVLVATGGLYTDVSAHKHTAEVRFRGAVSLHAPVRTWPATRVQAPD